MAQTTTETESDSAETDTDTDVDVASEGGRDAPSFLGRLLFGSVLAYTAIDSLRNIEGQVAYAESKGVPEADRLVPFALGMLSFGSIGIVLWRVPTLAAGAVATFLAAITPTMHDFWNADEDQKANEQNHFVKNTAMLGAALIFLERAREK
ncbi:DoxX family protein [Halomarina ordinaria]|uniref:DoxX family protein n=1 Tax=Halomarina ordinaria TaxID=3033939 RepID=A0ABD5U786_9EURY|nr:DoxX family protein [Halomarina sp. PSRA2]